MNISDTSGAITTIEASLGVGKGCIRFWARADQNSGFHSSCRDIIGKTVATVFILAGKNNIHKSLDEFEI